MSIVPLLYIDIINISLLMKIHEDSLGKPQNQITMESVEKCNTYHSKMSKSSDFHAKFDQTSLNKN